MGYNVSIPSNYLALMRSRLHINNKFNARKLRILLTLAMRGKSDSLHIWYLAGAGVSYSSIRASLHHLVELDYISHLSSGRYSILAKGLCFLYAVKELQPDIYKAAFQEYSLRAGK
jgi:hypothetical protein